MAALGASALREGPFSSDQGVWEGASRSTLSLLRHCGGSESLTEVSLEGFGPKDSS